MTPRSRLLRMLDANANRAREGARVLEDLARFVLDDAALGKRLRAVRHDLDAALASAAAPGLLLAARDSSADVGREDYRGAGATGARRDLRDLATANARRLEEALRVLEEGLRTLGAGPASARVQAARFSVYRLEQALTPRLPGTKALPDPCLYVILTQALAHAPLDRVCRQVLEGGATAIQLREKDATDRAVRALADKLRAITARAGALFFLNDRIDVARAVGADGVHLGPDDLPLAVARDILGPQAILGATCHGAADARAAFAAGADYVSAGPVFSAATKFRHLAANGRSAEPLAATGLRSVRAAARTGAPFVAIGGINPENIAAVAAAGARRVALCAAIISARNPRTAARRVHQALVAAYRTARVQGRK